MNDNEKIDIIMSTSDKVPSAITTQENEFVSGINKISDEVISQMNNMSVITPNDVTNLKKAEAFILQTYTDVRQFRPLITKLTSVLSNGRFPTADSKFWQSKSEAEVHFNELKRDMFKYEKSIIDIEEITFKIKSMEIILEDENISNYDKNIIGFDLRRLNIKKRQYEFEIKQVEKTMKYRIEEVTDWHKISEEFEGKCKYSTRNPNEHIADTHFKVLAYQIKNANTEDEKKLFRDQLNTFSSLFKKNDIKGDL